MPVFDIGEGHCQSSVRWVSIPNIFGAIHYQTSTDSFSYVWYVNEGDELLQQGPGELFYDQTLAEEAHSFEENDFQLWLECYQQQRNLIPYWNNYFSHSNIESKLKEFLQKLVKENANWQLMYGCQQKEQFNIEITYWRF